MAQQETLRSALITVSATLLMMVVAGAALEAQESEADTGLAQQSATQPESAPVPEETTESQPGTTPEQSDETEPARMPEESLELDSDRVSELNAEPDQQEVPLQSLVGTLQFLAHPVYPTHQALLAFQPLVDYLRDSTGLEIELVVEGNFHRYWINARSGKMPHLTLEDAHMAAWRMNNFDYQPLVTTGEPLSFSLLATGMDGDSLDDFYGRTISSLPSPSLGYLVLSRFYPNPLQQPRIQSTATSWLDAVEMVFSTEADGAIAPRPLVERYPNLTAIETSVELPGLTLSASPEVPDDIRQLLIDAFTALHENPEYHSALFEIDVDRFVTADPVDYDGLEEWFSGIFGM